MHFLTKLHHQISGFLKFIRIVCIAKNAADGKMIPLGTEDKILDIDLTDDVILIFLINGDTGIHRFPEKSKEIIIRGIRIDSDHINTGNHDVAGNSIAEIKDVVDDFPFLCFDNTILMADIHVGLQFIFSHGGFIIGIQLKKMKNKAGDFINYKNNGC